MELTATKIVSKPEFLFVKSKILMASKKDYLITKSVFQSFSSYQYCYVTCITQQSYRFCLTTGIAKKLMIANILIWTITIFLNTKTEVL